MRVAEHDGAADAVVARAADLIRAALRQPDHRVRQDMLVHALHLNRLARTSRTEGAAA